MFIVYALANRDKDNVYCNAQIMIVEDVLELKNHGRIYVCAYEDDCFNCYLSVEDEIAGTVQSAPKGSHVKCMKCGNILGITSERYLEFFGNKLEELWLD